MPKKKKTPAKTKSPTPSKVKKPKSSEKKKPKKTPMKKIKKEHISGKKQPSDRVLDLTGSPIRFPKKRQPKSPEYQIDRATFDLTTPKRKPRKSLGSSADKFSVYTPKGTPIDLS